MKYDGKNLQEVLEAHQRWLKKTGEWSELDRADFSGPNLHIRNLPKDLFNVNLSGADFSDANLSRALLAGANLSGANFYGANLSEASLIRANLTGANLVDANLAEADLTEANLFGVKVFGTNFARANLSDAKNVPFIPMACPDEGQFIAWKKAKYVHDGHYDWCIVKLLIPAYAKRSSGTGRKCRAAAAKVLEIQDKIGNPLEVEALSIYDNDFIYRVGETVTPRGIFEPDRWEECAGGIHFFVNREEAAQY